MLGIALGRAADPVPLAVWTTVCAAVLVAIGLFVRRRPNWTTATLALVVVLGGLAYQATRLPTDHLHAQLARLNTVSGVVASFPTHTDSRTRFVLNSDRLPGGIQVSHWHDHGQTLSVDYGDRLAIDAHVQRPPRFAGFDYRSYLATRNVWGIASVWNPGQVDHLASDAGHPWLHWAYQTRLNLFSVIDRHLSSKQSALMKGLLFGERAHMNDGVEENFRDAGVMHVLAVSGLHLAILLGMGWMTLRWLGVSITWTYLTLLPLVGAYLSIVGFKLSLLRASLMLAFVALGWVIAERGWILKRWVDSLQGLSAAALVILIVHPPTLFNVSFQLSFAATAGILIVLQLILPRVNAWRETLRQRWIIPTSPWRRWAFAGGEWLAMLGIITGAAQLALIPVMAWHFERLYLGAFLANLAIVPTVTVTLWLSVMFLVIAAIGLSGLASAMSLGVALVLTILMQIASDFAGLPWAHLVLDRTLLATVAASLPIWLRPSILQMLRAPHVRWQLMRDLTQMHS